MAESSPTVVPFPKMTIQLHLTPDCASQQSAAWTIVIGIARHNPLHNLIGMTTYLQTCRRIPVTVLPVTLGCRHQPAAPHLPMVFPLPQHHHRECPDDHRLSGRFSQVRRGRLRGVSRSRIGPRRLGGGARVRAAGRPRPDRAARRTPGRDLGSDPGPSDGASVAPPRLGARDRRVRPLPRAPRAVLR